jgi:ABC-type glycerol-3-phosphate transport system substrate-binding protein
MTRSVLAIVLCALLLSGCSASTSTAQDVSASDEVFADAYNNQQSDLQVTGSGTVIRILSDDNDGGRHQRFIVELASGQTLLISHNIDVAPRIDSLQEGDRVEFGGVYEWNDEGGVVHWTHHDPQGVHQAGWINHNGLAYQ